MVTFRELPDLEQGSDAWHDQRRGIVTASVVGRLLTSTLKVADNNQSRGLTAQLVAERLTGFTEPTYVSDAMLKGHTIEPLALDVYREHYAPVEETGFMVRDDWGFRIGYSPDGKVGDDGLVEIKSRLQKLHLQTILADEVPSEHMAQIQCGLLVSGRKWCDFLSYCGGMPLFVKRVTPDPVWHAAIVAAVEEFEANAIEMAFNYTQATKGLPMTERLVEMEMVI